MSELLSGGLSRLLTAATRIIEASDKLDDAGGLRRLPLGSKARQRALESLKEAQTALDGQVYALTHPCGRATPARPLGGRSVLLRRQANP